VHINNNIHVYVVFAGVPGLIFTKLSEGMEQAL